MSTDRGKYELKARARRQRETRARIVAATAGLHAELGPARTTVAEIARRAGVQRLTVYNHFPDTRDLLRACQGHFLAGHPPPDLASRATGGNATPAGLERTLLEHYRWFRANHAMERRVQYDRRVVPELDELLRENVDPKFDAAASVWAAALARDAKRRKAIRQLLRVAIEFRTWELLADGGAGEREMARLFAGLTALNLK